ncbi:MAG TPA: LysR family transcriptional regulator [Methylomusa anaerophila]|uniref:HTH-type transcriptional regulator CysL n=1 Tax=Methylomusa anaerophila TaxID=1930071 RepID=A0A348AMS3_9FIRM|nr:LysR family transcriptional regulator [Methylomusa anaerophila]BBB92371.1 HTH-type transcriptional regulator CysL [Methylomusa anaerophila]HML89990.1 LysR family transcriptional regulator [Methylomusa anaerophila]
MSYLQALTVFLTVVEEGSFSAAAKKLDLTQPTISFHIDNLEKNFSCPFFIRTSKGVSLTLYGEKLYESTRTINNLVQKTQNQIKSLIAGTAGHIIIGASTIPSNYILPPIAAKFLISNPAIRISVRSGDSQTILSAFENGEFPLAIVGKKPQEKLAGLPLWTDELILVAHPDFARGFCRNSLDLLKLPFVMRKESSGTRSVAMEALASHDIRPEQLKVVMEIDSNEALKAAVLHKVGVGFISKWAVHDELVTGKLVDLAIPEQKIVRQFYALCHQPLQPVCTESFWNFLLSQASEDTLGTLGTLCPTS